MDCVPMIQTSQKYSNGLYSIARDERATFVFHDNVITMKYLDLVWISSSEFPTSDAASTLWRQR